MLNVNCMKIHSIILSHLSWFKKLSSTHTHPLVSTHGFLKPYGVEWVIHGWGGVEWVIQGWGGVGHAVRQPKK